MLSPEAAQVITPLSDLINGTCRYQFGAGDDYKLGDVLLEKYSIEIKINYVNNVIVIRLGSPEVPFEQREELIYLRKDNNPLLSEDNLSAGNVFERRNLKT